MTAKRRLRWVSVLVAGVGCWSSCCGGNASAGLADERYEVGVAQVDITPDYPIRLSGFGFRRAESEGVTQRIYAKAMAIRQGAEPALVLLALDNLGVRMSMVDEIAERLRARYGIPRERVALTYTHSHTTPKVNGAADNLFSEPVPAEHQAHIDRYTRELTDWVTLAAERAVQDLRPARLQWQVGTVEFARNRRTPGGPVDHDLPVLVVRDEAGQLRAVYLSYACHCVTLSHNLISGDWAGYAQESLQRRFPGCVAMVSIGAGSDANPASGVVGDQVETAAAQGEEIADEVTRLLQGPWRPVSGALQARLQTIPLPLNELPTREQLTTLAAAGGPEGYNATTHLARLDRGEALPQTIAYPIQSFTFGECLHMVFLAGEVCVDYSLRLKRELDPKRLWVTAYSNDFGCYIPSERLAREGGYGGGAEIPYFALPTTLAAGLEQLIIDEVRRQTPATFVLPPPQP